MRRPDRLRPEDDGRVIADMAPLSGSAGDPGEPGESRPRQQPVPPMTKAETRQIMVSATLAGLTVAGVLSLAVVGLVLFCQFVWFR
jgi:hypothetical protein